jgi:cysteinyl-tRNA synthetase
MKLKLKLHNSISGEKEIFTPIDPNNIRMYVCGPTVYDRPHIGNARAVVVYDVLFRLLQNLYGADKITYVRNITDVDDKINKAATENGETIKQLTTRITEFFHADMAALNNLPPTYEPRATEYIEQIIALIQKIIANGHAYESEGHVLFNVKSFKGSHNKEFNYKYGDLSGKKLEDLIAGARIEVESYKRNPEDFVLWKPAADIDDESSKFESPWGNKQNLGRPGWHIECSAMSNSLLGENFDIHGGGADLKFPHHENEIAQSCAAHKNSTYAKYWVHNGFLTVNGEKMSKSLGNFTTVRELLERGIHGEVIRMVLLSTHYRKPLDFNEKALEDAKKTLDKFYGALKEYEKVVSNNENYDIYLDASSRIRAESFEILIDETRVDVFNNFMISIYDDLSTAGAIAMLINFSNQIPRAAYYPQNNEAYKSALLDWKSKFDTMTNLLGICQQTPAAWFTYNTERSAKKSSIDKAYIEQKIIERAEAKKAKNYKLADEIRNELQNKGITLTDTPNGTDWSF